MVGANRASVWAQTPLNKKKVDGLPNTPPMSEPKAKLKPITTHTTLITPIAIKLCSMVEMTFFLFTIPP